MCSLILGFFNVLIFYFFLVTLVMLLSFACEKWQKIEEKNCGRRVGIVLCERTGGTLHLIAFDRANVVYI